MHSETGLQGGMGAVSDGIADVVRGLTRLLADAFALYLKTKNVAWRVAHGREPATRAAFAEQADRLFAMTEAITERVRALGAARLPPLGQIAGLQRMLDDARCKPALDTAAGELHRENGRLVRRMRELHGKCARRGDTTTATMLRTWISKAAQLPGAVQ